MGETENDTNSTFNPPIIPKKKKPGKAAICTSDEVIELAYRMHCLRVPKCVVKQGVKEFVRKISKGAIAEMSPRTFERVMSRVRERLQTEAGKTRRDMRAESARFYEAMIADSKTPTRDKIRAQEALDKLYGLAVTRVIHTGTGEGGAVKVEEVKESIDLAALSREQLQALKEIRLAASGAKAVGDMVSAPNVGG